MRRVVISVRVLLFFIVLSLFSADLSVAKAGTSYHQQISKGIAQLKQNNIDSALAFFEASLTDNPEGVEAYYYIGVSHARANRTKMAEKNFIKALSQDRTFLPAHFDLGILYYQTGEDDKALEAFKVIELADPKRARVYYYQGIILRRNGKLKEGANKLEKAVSLDPELEVETRFQEGAFHYQSGQFDSALDAFETVVTLSPDGEMAQTSQEFIEQIKSFAVNEKRWKINASLGLQYDDNVILAPEGTSANAAEIKEKSDFVGVVFFRGTYRLLKNHRWQGDLAYSFFQNLHMESDLNDFNIQSHQLTLSAARLMGRKTLVLEYDIQVASLGGETFLVRNALGSELKMRHSKRHYSEIEYVYGSSDFKNSAPLFRSNDDRDVNTQLLRFTHYTFLKDNRFFYGEYAFEKESAGSSAAEDDWSFIGHRLKVGIVYPVRYSVILSAEGQIKLRRFDNINQRSSGKRKDDGVVIVLMASKPLQADIDLALQYIHYRNDSNIPVFEYRRNVAGVIVTAKF